jgi:ABC-type cobalt transport system substrate-binding protein
MVSDWQSNSRGHQMPNQSSYKDMRGGTKVSGRTSAVPSHGYPNYSMGLPPYNNEMPSSSLYSQMPVHQTDTKPHPQYSPIMQSQFSPPQGVQYVMHPYLSYVPYGYGAVPHALNGQQYQENLANYCNPDQSTYFEGGINQTGYFWSPCGNPDWGSGGIYYNENISDPMAQPGPYSVDATPDKSTSTEDKLEEHDDQADNMQTLSINCTSENITDTKPHPQYSPIMQSQFSPPQGVHYMMHPYLSYVPYGYGAVPHALIGQHGIIKAVC